jgi:hypothetical protein
MKFEVKSNQLRSLCDVYWAERGTVARKDSQKAQILSMIGSRIRSAIGIRSWPLPKS